MSNQSSIISSIYKSRRIMLELLNEQNYDISNYDKFDINEINSLYETQMLDMILEKHSSDGEETKGETPQSSPKIYIHYYLGFKYSQSKIQTLIDDLYIIEEKLKQSDILYIIGDNEPNDTMNDLVKDIWEKDKIFVIIQSIKRLQFNILNHSFQPKFRILNNQEKNEVKRKYNITTDENFPELSRYDPVSKAIFIIPGQLCEIIRPSKTSIESIYYRICV